MEACGTCDRQTQSTDVERQAVYRTESVHQPTSGGKAALPKLQSLIKDLGGVDGDATKQHQE